MSKNKNNWVKRRKENIMSEGKIYFVFAPWFCVTKQLYEVIIANIVCSVHGNIIARRWRLLTIYCLVDHTTYWYNERTYSFCLETNCLLYQLYDFLTFNLFKNRVTELYKVDLPWHVNCINLWNLSCVHKHFVLLRVVFKMCFVKLLHCFQSGCDDMQFAVELINQLVQAFLAAHDTRAQVTMLALK